MVKKKYFMARRAIIVKIIALINGGGDGRVRLDILQYPSCLQELIFAEVESDKSLYNS